MRHGRAFAAARPGAAIAVALATALTGGLAAGPSARPAAAAPPAIERKRAEAQFVLAQVRELDSRVGRAIEAWNLATIRLDEVTTSVRANARDVRIARSNLERAQHLLATHLVSLYTSDTDPGGLEVLLGSEDIGDLIDRIDAQDRISTQDKVLIEQVRIFRRAMLKKQAELARARTLQQRELGRRTAQRRTIEGQLRERQRLLSTIEDEVARLEAEEQARQERLRRELEARLAAQRREAARRAAAAEAAEAARRAAGETVPEQPKPESLLGLAAETPDGPAAIPPARFSGVVGIAMQYLGVPYVWGGASPSGFDCSGFVLYVYNKLGISLPHHAATQYGYGVPVSKSQLEPGDLVFFDGLGHNGIYIGGRQFIHAPHSGDFVKISSLDSVWYSSKWVGARRL